ncbi:hypothetical protein BC833DRAFT_608690 [Globomyces pollinis-pini]|nr:hypothetical protein BC833DRAFT_608690 [Globomyces pollinis-pini]
MRNLWIKFKTNNATKVSTEECQDVDDFLKACKKELPSTLGSYDVSQLCLSTTVGGAPLQPDGPIPAQNTEKAPLFIRLAVEEQAQEEMVSMTYGKASMPFISEATGIEDNHHSWENIPVDTTVEVSSEFVELFKKNYSVFEFWGKASRKILIEMFLREVVAQFPDFIIVYDNHMTLVNEAKKRRLNGKCDYTICHRGLRNLPHLVVITAEVTNQETMLQCIGECASIYYCKKEAGMSNPKVYGIHSTGSVWKFIFIDGNGSFFISQEYYLNPENYVKEEFDLIYRLVYYVVEQTHINNPRLTPADSV